MFRALFFLLLLDWLLDCFHSEWCWLWMISWDRLNNTGCVLDISSHANMRVQNKTELALQEFIRIFFSFFKNDLHCLNCAQIWLIMMHDCVYSIFTITPFYHTVWQVFTCHFLGGSLTEMWVVLHSVAIFTELLQK